MLIDLIAFFGSGRLPRTNMRGLNIGTLLALMLNIGLNFGPGSVFGRDRRAARKLPPGRRAQGGPTKEGGPASQSGDPARGDPERKEEGA